MTVEEQVRRTMLAYADDVAVDPTAGRATRAREQARVMRVRRNAGVAVAVAAVAAVAVGIGTSGILRADPPPEPAPRPERVVAVASEFAGRTLIASDETHDGEPLVLTVDAPSGSQWMVTCAGLSREYVVHRTIGGRFEETAPCGALEVLGETMSFRWSSADPAGTGVELALWITRNGEEVRPDGAILAAAVYETPEAVATVAGSDILPLETSLAREWAYLDSVESAPGRTTFTHRFPASEQEVLLELVTDPVGTRAEVEVLVDGYPSGTHFPFGGTNLGDTLSAGAPHTVTLRVTGDVPPDGRMAIVRRTPAG